jgi:hypothetical protein
MRREHEEGRVYFADRDDLLAYGYVRRYLDWDAENSDGDVTIHVRAVHDTLAERWVPTLDELDGLTFYTPDPQRTRVLLDGDEIGDLTVNAPDRTRRGSVTISVSAAQPDGPVEAAPEPGSTSSSAGRSAAEGSVSTE